MIACMACRQNTKATGIVGELVNNKATGVVTELVNTKAPGIVTAMVSTFAGSPRGSDNPVSQEMVKET